MRRCRLVGAQRWHHAHRAVEATTHRRANDTWRGSTALGVRAGGGRAAEIISVLLPELVDSEHVSGRGACGHWRVSRAQWPASASPPPRGQRFPSKYESASRVPIAILVEVVAFALPCHVHRGRPAVGRGPSCCDCRSRMGDQNLPSSTWQRETEGGTVTHGGRTRERIARGGWQHRRLAAAARVCHAACVPARTRAFGWGGGVERAGGARAAPAVSFSSGAGARANRAHPGAAFYSTQGRSFRVSPSFIFQLARPCDRGRGRSLYAHWGRRWPALALGLSSHERALHGRCPPRGRARTASG